MFLAGACGVHWAHGPINVICVDFKDSQFEFRVNKELTKRHMDFSVSSSGSPSKASGGGIDFPCWDKSH